MTSKQRTMARRRYSRRKLKKQLALSPATIILLLLAVSCVYPLFFLATTALRPASEYGQNPLTLPSTVTFDNLVDAWNNGGLGQLTLNTLFIVAFSVAGLLLTAAAAAFGIVHLPLPRRVRAGSRLVAVLLLALPATVLLVPITSVVQDLGLTNNYLGLILVYISLQLPFGIYMLTSFFESVPISVLEAATMDGAGPLRQFWSVGLPLAKPAIATLGALTALTVWNELLFALLIIQDPASRTVTAGVALLQSSFAGSSSATIQSAGLLIATMGPLLIFIVMNRALMRGLVAGAVK